MRSAEEVAVYFQQTMPKLASLTVWYGTFKQKENMQIIVKEIKQLVRTKINNVDVQNEIIEFIKKEWIYVQNTTLSIPQYIVNIKCVSLILMVLAEEPQEDIEGICELLNPVSYWLKSRYVTNTQKNSLCNSLDSLKINSLKYSEHVIDISNIFNFETRQDFRDIILRLQRTGHQHFSFVNINEPQLFECFFDNDGKLHLESLERIVSVSVDINFNSDTILKYAIECGYIDMTQRDNFKMYPSTDSDFSYPYWHFNGFSPSKWKQKIEFSSFEIVVNNWLYEINLEGAIKIVHLLTNTIFSRQYENENFFLFLEFKLCKNSNKILSRRSKMDPLRLNDFYFFEYRSIDEVDEEEENSLAL